MTAKPVSDCCGEIDIRHIRQPENSNLCGQAVIAMLGNMTIYEAIELVGKSGGTRTKDIVESLRALGFQCADRLKRIPKSWIKPKLCIIHLRFKINNKGHWSLWNGYKNQFNDPAFINPINKYFKGEVKIMSYLEIKNATSPASPRGRIEDTSGDGCRGGQSGAEGSGLSRRGVGSVYMRWRR